MLLVHDRRSGVGGGDDLAHRAYREDGFEVFVPPAQAERVWDAILATGRDAGLVPAGLAARDTLRLRPRCA